MCHSCVVTRSVPRPVSGETLSVLLPFVGWLTMAFADRRDPSDVQVMAARIFQGRAMSATEAGALGLSRRDAKEIVASAARRYRRAYPDDPGMADATLKTLHDSYWSALP